MKGMIALDIDGTLTPPGQEIAWEVVQYLLDLARDHWMLVIVTGRTFGFGFQVLEHLPFPYYFVVQNGAITIEMPSRAIVTKKYLDAGIIPVMEEICQSDPSDFVIYTGFEYNDVCYYRSRHFSEELRNYLKSRTAKFKENWQDVAAFDPLKLTSFPSVKCFGNQGSAAILAQHIEQKLGLHVPLIRDPFDSNYFVAQATNPKASKGEAVKALAAIHKPKVIIAAGDDYNDRTMLLEANIKVVMATAPADMQKTADVIAPPATEHGIIAGLTKAIALSQRM